MFPTLALSPDECRSALSTGERVTAGAEFANAGLHGYVADVILPDLESSGLALSGAQVLELGAGSGSFATRLAQRGASVVAADVASGGYADYSGPGEFVALDLDTPAFSTTFAGRTFDLVVAIEVIEHLESPLGFLREAAQLTRPGGYVVVTTPNVDNFPSRILFGISGQLRGASATDDPGHISPILLWTFTQRIVPRTGLLLEQQWRYPPHGFLSGPGLKRRALTAVAPLLRRAGLHGDNHVFVLRK